ncbi:unnamed protein product [Amoebophrya sp. A120]|nr:unnamed protein product [Amoebophrya sp. A120]|eukprot:GSA120T00025017001.1
MDFERGQPAPSPAEVGEWEGPNGLAAAMSARLQKRGAQDWSNASPLLKAKHELKDQRFSKTPSPTKPEMRLQSRSPAKIGERSQGSGHVGLAPGARMPPTQPKWGARFVAQTHGDRADKKESKRDGIKITTTTNAAPPSLHAAVESAQHVHEQPQEGRSSKKDLLEKGPSSSFDASGSGDIKPMKTTGVGDSRGGDAGVGVRVEAAGAVDVVRPDNQDTRPGPEQGATTQTISSSDEMNQVSTSLSRTKHPEQRGGKTNIIFNNTNLKMPRGGGIENSASASSSSSSGGAGASSKAAAVADPVSMNKYKRKQPPIAVSMNKDHGSDKPDGKSASSPGDQGGHEKSSPQSPTGSRIDAQAGPSLLSASGPAIMPTSKARANPPSGVLRNKDTIIKTDEKVKANIITTTDASAVAAQDDAQPAVSAGAASSKAIVLPEALPTRNNTSSNFVVGGNHVPGASSSSAVVQKAASQSGGQIDAEVKENSSFHKNSTTTTQKKLAGHAHDAPVGIEKQIQKMLNKRGDVKSSGSSSRWGDAAANRGIPAAGGADAASGSSSVFKPAGRGKMDTKNVVLDQDVKKSNFGLLGVAAEREPKHKNNAKKFVRIDEKKGNKADVLASKKEEEKLLPSEGDQDLLHKTKKKLKNNKNHTSSSSNKLFQHDLFDVSHGEFALFLDPEAAAGSRAPLSSNNTNNGKVGGSPKGKGKKQNKGKGKAVQPSSSAEDNMAELIVDTASGVELPGADGEKKADGNSKAQAQQRAPGKKRMGLKLHKQKKINKKKINKKPNGNSNNDSQHGESEDAQEQPPDVDMDNDEDADEAKPRNSHQKKPLDQWENVTDENFNVARFLIDTVNSHCEAAIFLAQPYYLGFDTSGTAKEYSSVSAAQHKAFFSLVEGLQDIANELQAYEEILRKPESGNQLPKSKLQPNLGLHPAASSSPANKSTDENKSQDKEEHLLAHLAEAEGEMRRGDRKKTGVAKKNTDEQTEDVRKPPRKRQKNYGEKQQETVSDGSAPPGLNKNSQKVKNLISVDHSVTSGDAPGDDLMDVDEQHYCSTVLQQNPLSLTSVVSSSSSSAKLPPVQEHQEVDDGDSVLKKPDLLAPQLREPQLQQLKVEPAASKMSTSSTPSREEELHYPPLELSEAAAAAGDDWEDEYTPGFTNLRVIDPNDDAFLASNRKNPTEAFVFAPHPRIDVLEAINTGKGVKRPCLEIPSAEDDRVGVAAQKSPFEGVQDEAEGHPDSKNPEENDNEDNKKVNMKINGDTNWNIFTCQPRNKQLSGTSGLVAPGIGYSRFCGGKPMTAQELSLHAARAVRRAESILQMADTFLYNLILVHDFPDKLVELANREDGPVSFPRAASLAVDKENGRRELQLLGVDALLENFVFEPYHFPIQQALRGKAVRRHCTICNTFLTWEETTTNTARKMAKRQYEAVRGVMVCRDSPACKAIACMLGGPADPALVAEPGPRAPENQKNLIRVAVLSPELAVSVPDVIATEPRTTLNVQAGPFVVVESRDKGEGVARKHEFELLDMLHQLPTATDRGANIIKLFKDLMHKTTPADEPQPPYVMEFFPEILSNILESPKNRMRFESALERLKITQGLQAAGTFLRNAEIVHGQCNPRHIGLRNDGTPVLFDFRHASKVDVARKFVDVRPLTAGPKLDVARHALVYTSPEFVDAVQHGPESYIGWDVWRTVDEAALGYVASLCVPVDIQLGLLVTYPTSGAHFMQGWRRVWSTGGEWQETIRGAFEAVAGYNFLTRLKDAEELVHRRQQARWTGSGALVSDSDGWEDSFSYSDEVERHESINAADSRTEEQEVVESAKMQTSP